MACGVTVMYGPPGSGVRILSGIFVEGSWRRQDFVPPSSLMHRRSLMDRIGPWGHPDMLSAPVDCDLLQRAFHAGARLVSTERLTVFKFNSAFRRDSYLHRDAGEQQAMLERLQANPARCVEQEWAGLMRARCEHRLIDHSMPDEWTVPPGFIHRINLSNRGLQDLDIHEVSETRRFSLDDQPSAMDWYGVESMEEWGTFRWSGPSPVTSLMLPVRVPHPFRIRLQLLNWLGVDLASEVALRIAGQKIEFTCEQVSAPAVRLVTGIVAPHIPADGLRVQINVGRLRCPLFETDGASQDKRWLGVCVNWVEVEPVTRPTVPSRELAQTRSS